MRNKALCGCSDEVTQRGRSRGWREGVGGWLAAVGLVGGVSKRRSSRPLERLSDSQSFGGYYNILVLPTSAFAPSDSFRRTLCDAFYVIIRTFTSEWYSQSPVSHKYSRTVATDAAQFHYSSLNSSVPTKLSIFTFIIVRKQQLLFNNVDLRFFFQNFIRTFW